MREDAVLEPGEEHDGELEPLRGVQRHERDDATAFVVVRDLVGVGDEGDPLEELRQPAVGRLAGPRRGGPRLRAPDPVRNRQLADGAVVHPLGTRLPRPVLAGDPAHRELVVGRGHRVRGSREG